MDLNSAEKQDIGISEEDVKMLKEALKHAVNEVNSTSMFGVETVSFVWFKNKDDRIFNNLNYLVKIKKENDETIVDYSEVMNVVGKDVEIEENYENKVKNAGL